jgi:hypothetical protein
VSCLAGSADHFDRTNRGCGMAAMLWVMCGLAGLLRLTLVGQVVSITLMALSSLLSNIS